MAAREATVEDYGLEDTPDWRSVRWPEQLRAITVEGRRVQLAALGSGERRPVLLVHGLAGRWQTWLANLPRLGASRRVVAVDLPGFGRSQMPVEALSVSGYARTLERVIDLLELEAPLVGGHGFGGVVATELAINYPERVGALALVAAPWLGDEDLRTRVEQVTIGLGLGLGSRIVETLPPAALARPRVRQLALAAAIRHPSRLAPDLLGQLVYGLGAPGRTAALQALLEHARQSRSSPAVGPRLIVQGANDMLVATAAGERLASAIGGGALELLADCGHMPMLEHPRRFNAILERFADQDL